MRKSHRWGVAVVVVLGALPCIAQSTQAQEATAVPAERVPGTTAEPATTVASPSDPVDPVFKIERLAPLPSSAPLPAPPATTVSTAQADERQPIFVTAPRTDSVPDKVPLPRSFRPTLSLSYVLGPLLGMGATALLGPVGLAFFAVPVLVHFAYLDPMGGLVTLFGYPATVGTGVLAGAALSQHQCSFGGSGCNFDGIVIGGVLGAVTWSLVDVLLLAPKTWRGNHPPERSVAIGVLSGGGAGLSWSDRF